MKSNWLLSLGLILILGLTGWRQYAPMAATTPIDETRNETMSRGSPISSTTAFLSSSDLFSRYLVLDGVDDYASAADKVSIDLGTNGQSLTIEGWFYVDNPNLSRVEVIGCKWSGYCLSIQRNAGSPDLISFRVWEDNGTNSDTITAYLYYMTAGWHHIAGVFDNDADTFSLYYDGEQKASTSLSTNLFNSSNPFTVGGLPTANYFLGYIEEVRLSSNVRYSGTSYTVPNTPFTSDGNTRALWHFNEALGATTFLDSSGYGNTLAGVNHAHIGGPPLPPDEFNKTAPVNDATGHSTNPTLSWEASTGATSYRYCFGDTTDACSSDCSSWTDNGTSTSKATGELNSATTYYWHVCAINAEGTTYSNGSISDYWSFTTVTMNSVSINSTGSQDGWILESTETSKIGGSMNSTTSTLRLGDNAAKKQYRSILSFATGSGLPDDAVITGVTLKIRKQGVIGGGNPVTAFQGFMTDIRKGYFGTSVLQTADFQTAASKTYGPFKPALSGGWYSIDLTGGKNYINKVSASAGLTQIRLRFKLDDNNNTVANYLSLYSGNASSSYRPQLVIEYYVP
jgi:hypothetical protein